MESIFEMIPVICISDDSAFHNVQLSIIPNIIHGNDRSAGARRRGMWIVHLNQFDPQPLRVAGFESFNLPSRRHLHRHRRPPPSHQTSHRTGRLAGC